MAEPEVACAMFINEFMNKILVADMQRCLKELEESSIWIWFRKARLFGILMRD